VSATALAQWDAAIERADRAESVASARLEIEEREHDGITAAGVLSSVYTRARLVVERDRIAAERAAWNLAVREFELRAAFIIPNDRPRGGAEQETS
jgi:hypothetical protein